MGLRFTTIAGLAILIGCSTSPERPTQPPEPKTQDQQSVPAIDCQPATLRDAVAHDPAIVAEIYEGNRAVASCKWIDIVNGIALAKPLFVSLYPLLKTSVGGAAVAELDSALGFVLQDRAALALQAMANYKVSRATTLTAATKACRALPADDDLDTEDEKKAVRTHINDLRLRKVGLDKVKDPRLQKIKAACAAHIRASLKSYESKPH